MKWEMAFWLLITICTHATHVVASAAETSVFNFSHDNIYLLNLCTKQKTRLAPFESETIPLHQNTCTLFINDHSHMIKPCCRLTANDHHDIFVTKNQEQLACTPRAKRLPREY